MAWLFRLLWMKGIGATIARWQTMRAICWGWANHPMTDSSPGKAEAHSQIPTPLVQCAMAWSILGNCR